MGYYSGKFSYSSASTDAKRVAAANFSKSIGDIDGEIQHIFLHLQYSKLEEVYRLYGALYGKSAKDYARKTYQSWKSGFVQMSGMIADRLLDLVPAVLSSEQRFELVKKVRAAQIPKVFLTLNCSPTNWREVVVPAIGSLIDKNNHVQFDPKVMQRIHWLAYGDVIAAQKLLIAAEQEEAAIRLRFIEEEFLRIDSLLKNIDAIKQLKHTIKLPQGNVSIVIRQPKRDLWRYMRDLLK